MNKPKNTNNGRAPWEMPSEAVSPTLRTPQRPQLTLEQAMKLAEAHQAHGRLPQAEIVLRDILKQNPNFAPAIHLLGVVAHMAGNTEAAIGLIERAVALAPKAALFWANLCEMQRLMKNYDAAIKAGRKAVELDPKMIAAHGNLGISYYDNKDDDKARYHHSRALKLNPNFAPSLNNMGSILRREDDYEGAEKYFRDAIKADPNFLDPQNNLGEILTRQDQPEEGLKLLDEVLKKNPRYESALCNRGLALLALGDEAESRKSYHRALQVDPKFPPALAGIVMLALEFHTHEDGERAARALCQVEPDEPDSYSMLGSVLMAQGRTDEAEQCYNKAMELDPDYVPARTGMGHVLMERGDLAGAEELFRACVEAEGDNHSSLYSLVQCKKMKADDPEIAMLEEDAKKLDGHIVPSKAIPLNFALGKMYDDIGEYEKGFPYYIAGCALKRKAFDYSMEEKEANTKKIMDLFSKDFIKKNSGHGSSSDVPIFVLGMPRSGTTLTEQIIASHPDVFGAGELSDVQNLIEAIPGDTPGMHYTERLPTVIPGKLKEMGDKYVEGVQERSPGTPHITDKMPGNFHYIGLIHLMLPNAKIIHVRRHPLDTCISCFTRLFAHGQAATYDLKEVGHSYKCYVELMEHWRKVLPKNSFYEFRYEDLVDNTEEEARKIIDYAGLEWNDACLEFYKHKRSIRTASVTQVRQPIYKSSKQRWKNYDKFLGPLKEGLGDAIKY